MWDITSYSYREGSQREQEVRIPVGAASVRIPLRSQEWEEWLRPHPDRVYTQYWLQGLKDGFRIGFRYGERTYSSAKSNMQSAMANPSVVDEYLEKDVGHGRVIGPLSEEEYPTAHVSHFGVIPKSKDPKEQPTQEWRLIVDLSHPMGASVNDDIEPELCTLKYTSVDEAVRLVLSSGTVVCFCY